MSNQQISAAQVTYQQQDDSSINVRRNELVQKYSKLQVFKDLSKANDASIDEKTKLLSAETKILDELHQKAWDLQNDMCNKVWAFAEKHDFATVLNTYPDIKADLSLDCGCVKGNQEDRQQENEEVERLSLEIRKLESELSDYSFNLLRKDLEKAEKKLKECHEQSPESAELERKIKDCKQRIVYLKAAERNRRNVNNSDNNSDSNNVVVSVFVKKTSSHAATVFSQTPSTSVFPVLKSSTRVNSDFKRKSNAPNGKLTKNDLKFVTANKFMNNMNNQVQSNKSSNRENNARSSTTSSSEKPEEPPKKKFVCKTKSLITGVLKRS